MFCFLVVVINKAMQAERRKKLTGSQGNVNVIEIPDDGEDIWYLAPRWSLMKNELIFIFICKNWNSISLLTTKIPSDTDAFWRFYYLDLFNE